MLATGELLVIAIVAIIAVDPKKLPDLMKGLGKAIGEFKQMSTDVKRSFEREAEMADFEKRKAEAHEQLYGSGAQTPAETPTAPLIEQPEQTSTAAPEATASAPGASDTPGASETPESDEDAFARAEGALPTEDALPTEETPPAEEAPSAEEAPASAVASVSDESPAPDEAPASGEAPAPQAAPAADETLPAPAAQAEAPALDIPAEAPAIPVQADVPAEVTPAAPPAEAGDGGTPPPPPTGDAAVGEGESGRMSLFSHLNDLRKRLTRSVLAVLVGFLACYAFAGHMLKILMQPMLNALHQSHFIYTLPTEAFFAEMWIAFLAGLFVASPYIFYQIWSFIAPGLYSHERRWIIPIALCSAIFFVSGALFGYFVVFPFGFEFFASYASDILFFTPKLDEYLGFALKLLFAFGIVFELPLFIFFLARLGIVSHVGLRAKRKYAILGAFIVAAALTPPDAISQTMMAVPLCVLYEVGIWGAYFFGKKKPQAEEPPAEASA